MHAKYAIILMDGAADEPLDELGGKTPLEVADIPHLDDIVQQGRIGTVRTVPDGFAPGSDVATMSLLGYDARRHYSGRAPIEAVARNIPLQPDDIVFRCNLVTVVGGEMTDFTAGHIRTAESQQIMAALNEALASQGVRFHAGVSYRNLMVMSDPAGLDVACMPPHDIPGEPIADYLPKGRGAKCVRQIADAASVIVAAHDVNRVREDLGEAPATHVWLWGQGRVPIMPRFRQRFGVAGAVIAGVDLIRGLGKLLGWTIIDVPGATGSLDTDYAAKGRHAVAALDEHNLIVVHVEAADEAGHMGDAAAKIAAIEKTDAHIVGPILEALRAYEPWRILVAPDHPTPVALRVHTNEPPPFCMAGTGVPQGLASSFNEHIARDSDFQIEQGHELMEYFLRQ